MRLHGGEEVFCGLVEAGGDPAELLDSVEEAFDEVACLVVVLGGADRVLPVGLWRDVWKSACDMGPPDPLIGFQ